MTTTKPANINLGKTQITPLIRVSSAAIYYEDWPADYWLVETWIFSDDPQQESHQIIHGTTSPSCSQRLAELSDKARNVHAQIASNLMQKYNP